MSMNNEKKKKVIRIVCLVMAAVMVLSVVSAAIFSRVM